MHGDTFVISKPLGTAALAQTVLSLSLLATPATASPLAGLAEQDFARAARKGTSRQSFSRNSDAGKSTSVSSATAISSVVESYLDDFGRATTPQEELIGEVRSWALWNENWDGEGAKVPVESSLREAVNFVRLIKSEQLLPDAMLFASGRSGLYWHESGLYADLEFLGDGRIAYFIKIDADQHKGVVGFDSKKLPAVFQALLLG